MNINLNFLIIVSVCSAIISGLYFPQYIDQYVFLGHAFITLLKYLVVPLVFGSLITGIVSLGSISSLRMMGVKTLFYVVLTTMISSVVGIFFAVVFQPGKDLQLQVFSDSVAVPGHVSFTDLFATIFPNNFFDVISGSHMLFIILLSTGIGLVILVFGRHITFPLNELFDGFNEFMVIITQWVIRVSPLGIYGLVARLIVETGVGAFIPLIQYVLVVLFGLTAYATGVLSFIIIVVTRLSPMAVFKDVFTSLSAGLATASSSASLPILMDDVRNKLKVPNKVASFVLPLGITINMNGTAIFQSVAVIFIAQIYGIPLSFSMVVMMIIMVLLASISSAAVPSAGIITLSMILTMIGIPIEGITIILAVDRLLDMVRTSVNLWGNAIASIVITIWLGGAAYE